MPDGPAWGAIGCIRGRTPCSPACRVFMVRMVDTVQGDGAGFVGYIWNKPGVGHPVEKLSFGKSFAPWGWVLGSGIYLDDVNTAVGTAVAKFAAGVLVVLLVVL